MEENAKRSAEWRKKGTKEEQDAKKAAHAARVKEKRRAKKLAQNSQNQALPEFQRIQTVPKALQVSKSQSHKGGLPRRNDGTPSSGSDDELLSDYEKLRLLNIQERQEKFKQQFGTLNPFGGGPSQSKKQSLPPVSLESSDDDFISKAKPSSSRIMPKRNCNLKATNTQVDSSSDDFDMYLDDLVESAVANVETKQDDARLVVISVLESLIASVIQPKSGVYKRKFSLGRKTKDAKRFSQFRKNHESQSQYEARLKRSSKLKSNMKTLDNGVHHDRKLEILKDKR